MPTGIEFRPIEDLIPYAQNVRTHSETQVEAISLSISQFGFTNPVLIAADNTIIAGHSRVTPRGHGCSPLGLVTMKPMRGNSSPG
uniref:ParB N-terminal domain-containing protein n=1 Tax=Tateyamaria pelophila TaxID=328415 RepID=UPI001CBE837E|nr:ParB N-terminal domain-containing protein [Tateyamaria pelophila]